MFKTESISVLMKYKNSVLRFLLLIHYITFQDLLPLSEFQLPYMKNKDDYTSLLGLYRLKIKYECTLLMQMEKNIK